MRRPGAVLLLLLAFAMPAAADGFDSVVKKVESHYGVHRLFPRLIGFAIFVAKPATWGSGVGGLKVAVFEAEGRTFNPLISELEEIVQTSIGRDWRPFVRVDSRRKREATVIYANPHGKKLHMLVATVEHGDICVVQMKLNPKAFKRWREDPESEAENTAHHH